jgi:tellurite methyltransferase
LGQGEKMKFKDKKAEQDYWNDFYSKSFIDVPSQFCVSITSDVHKKKTIVEFGSGAGRDSLYLASIGYVAVAMDLSVKAVEKCNNAMQKQGVEHAVFLCGDMSSSDDVKEVIDTARNYAHNDDSKLVVYSRFVMHALDDQQEYLFLTALTENMNQSEYLYLEFRSTEDMETEKYFGNDNHFRRYIDSDKFVSNLKTKYGFGVIYSITGQGMARYKNEDPFVSRIIAVKA